MGENSRESSSLNWTDAASCGTTGWLNERLMLYERRSDRKARSRSTSVDLLPTGFGRSKRRTKRRSTHSPQWPRKFGCFWPRQRLRKRAAPF